MSGLRGAGLGDHHDVDGRVELAPDLAHDLPHEPFDAVSHDGIPDPRADRDADSTPAPARRRLQDDEVLGVLTAPIALNPEEFPSLPESRELGKASWLGHPGCFGGIDTVRRLRPFARRRLRTLRPPGVAMRARNPWVRFRRRLLG
jgi:hypothetical protein